MCVVAAMRAIDRYVLYKERNMLLSEKERAQMRQTQMVGPERLIRVSGCFDSFGDGRGA